MGLAKKIADPKNIEVLCQGQNNASSETVKCFFHMINYYLHSGYRNNLCSH